MARSAPALLPAVLLAAASALLLASVSFVCAPAPQAGCRRSRKASRASSRIARRAGDTFDPWTVLGISPDADEKEARRAYKKLITKYHPDVDPSPEAAAKFEQIVRANAVVCGEDKNLDEATMLKNAVENMRNDIEFRRAQIEKLKGQAVEEEARLKQMEEDLEATTAKSEKVSQELSMFGGGALGLLVGGPGGALVGAVLGLAVKDREDPLGQIVRGTGTLAQSVANAVGKAADGSDSAEEKEPR